MRSRLGASLSPLFTGYSFTPHLNFLKSKLSSSSSSLWSSFTGLQRRHISKAISAKPWLTFLNTDGHSNRLPHNRTLARLQLQGIESLKRSLHSFVDDDDDDFSELGPATAQRATKQLKLMTEKRELYGVKTSPSVPRKLQNQNYDSRYAVNTKNASHLPNSSSITIEDVPSIVKLSQLIGAISIFGEISRASMRTLPNGLHCCDVEFQSRRRAVSAGGITVKSFHLPIHPPHPLETVTIRIKNISNETADAAIHSICMSFGSLEGLARTEEDAVDALYSVKDNLDLQSILKNFATASLYTFPYVGQLYTFGGNCLEPRLYRLKAHLLPSPPLGDRRWSASLLSRDCTPVAMSNNEDSKHKLGLQISSHLKKLKRSLSMKKIDVEDLESLHLAILHLEETPDIHLID
ncbi:unnamed protein product [Camellia sinensis]